MRWLAAATATLTLLLTPVRAEPLVADLSSHLIAIGSGFTGAEVLLYGAVDGEGDLAIVVRGPEQRVVVRRKHRIAGIWVNRERLTFDDVPAFYAVAASRPLDEIGRASLLRLHRIGLETLDFRAVEPRAHSEVARFRAALVRSRVREGLYSREPAPIGFLGERLFRTRLTFPANVPTGTYNAEIFLIRDGEVVSAETTPLFISKTGFQAEINFLARTRPALYGLAAVVLALVAGWTAAVVFRKT